MTLNKSDHDSRIPQHVIYLVKWGTAANTDIHDLIFQPICLTSLCGVDVDTAANEARHRDGFYAAGLNFLKPNTGMGCYPHISQTLTY